jgi:general secretion pathway protein A
MKRHDAVFAYTGGIPRKTNTLIDRVLLMGYLEEMHISRPSTSRPSSATSAKNSRRRTCWPRGWGRKPTATRGPTRTGCWPTAGNMPERRASAEVLDERMMRLEKSIVSVLSILKKIVANPPNGVQAAQQVDTQE